jgi:hypothetical protein
MATENPLGCLSKGCYKYGIPSFLEKFDLDVHPGEVMWKVDWTDRRPPKLKGYIRGR